MKNKIIEFVIKHPMRSFILVMICFIPLVGGIQKIESDFGARIWYSKKNPMIVKLDQFIRTYGNDDNVGVAIFSKEKLFTKEALGLISEITEKLWLVKDVVRVDSLANYNWTSGTQDEIIVEPLYDDPSQLTQADLELIEKRVLTDKILPNYMISPDGDMSLITGNLRPVYQDGKNNLDNQAIVTSLNEIISEVQKKYPKYEIRMFGSAVVTDAYRAVSKEDVGKTIPLLLLTIIGFLLYTFRSKEGVIIPILIITTSVAMTFGVMGHVGISFNNMMSTVPGILTAICIADTVHLLATLYMKLGEGLNFKEAIRASLHKNLGPTLLTSISTAIGFATLMTSEIVPIKGLGGLAAIGTLFAWFLTIFLIPALFGVFPTHWFVPKNGYKEKKGQYFNHERSSRYIDFIYRNRVLIVAIFSASFIGAIILSFQNQVNSDPLKYFSKDVPVRITSEMIKDEMGGIGGPQVVVHSGKADGVKTIEFLSKLEKYEAWLKTIEGVSTSISILDIVKKMNQVFNGGDEKFYALPDSDAKVAQFLFLYSLNLPQGMGLNSQISVDYENTKVQVIWRNYNSKDAVVKIDQINARAKDFGLTAFVSGQMPLYQRLNGYVVKTFINSMGLALFLVACLMVFIFRSFKLGMLSMLPNIVPLVFGGALMALLGIDIDLGAAIDYSVCLGVVVDDTIHFLFDYNRNRKDGFSIRDSLVHVMTNTGGALILTTIILSVGFGLFVISKFVPNINFGLFCALIFTIALIVDLVFLPALLLLPVKKENYQTT